MSNLQRIAAKGQSIWVDELRRGWMTTGDLQEMIDDHAVTGMTSNPTIFAEAVSTTSDYREQLEQLVQQGAGRDDLYEALVTQDIQDACDLLRPVWDRTSGRDGYVSIEVSPYLAHDTEATIQEVRAWHKRIARPNCLVKVPATLEGLPVIEQMIGEGLNINVTLTFGLDRYRQVVEAYLSGLERFVSEGGDPSTVFSVASFFVSRVDVEVDKRLDRLAADALDQEHREILSLRGEAGIANARAAYGIFQEMFSGSRWEKLAEAGAGAQKVLWASTSVKDPAYPDTMYVEALLAPETVNTMPTSTMRAFEDHGDPETEPFDQADIEEAVRTLERLGDAGIDYHDVVSVLEDEGVEKFESSFDELMACLDATRAGLTSRAWSISNRTVEDLPDGMVRRIWSRDPAVWVEGEDHSADRLGWIDLPDSMSEEIPRLQSFAGAIPEDTDRVVLLGMGGSSLAPEMFMRTFGAASAFPELVVLDSTHPAQIESVQHHLDPERTLFLVSSKSGTTLETISLYRYFRDLIDDGQRFVAVTDPGSPLAELADREGFRATFLNPPDIGGRYSALSLFGLVPAALMGLDLSGLLSAAQEASRALHICVPEDHNSGLVIGTAMGRLALDGRDKLTFLIPQELASFGDWAEQLIAESTGKQGTGIIPIVDEPRLDPDRYGDDRTFVHLAMGDGEHDDLVGTLEELGHPVITIKLDGPIELGREIFRWEFATAVSGAVMGINPFDQPNVEAAKRRSKEVLAEAEAIEWAEEDPTDLFRGISPPDYAAILAFAPASESHRAALSTARRRLAEEHGVATMVGFGPRYLHSTGQLHKGGPDRVRALVVLDPPDEEVMVPGADYDFGRLIRAQAAGDAHALRAAGRPVARTSWKRFADWLGSL